MKILWLSHLIPYPPKAGVILRCYQLVTELSRSSEIDFLTFHQPKLMGPLVNDLEEGVAEARETLRQYINLAGIYDIPCDISKYGNYLLALRSLFSRYGYTINWLDSNVFRNALINILSENSYDLIHVDTISFYKYFDICRKTGVPIVLDHHNVESHMMKRRSEKEKNLFKKIYFLQEYWKLKKYEREMSEQVSMNITCSEQDRDRLIETAKKARVDIVPNGVDTNYFYPDEENSGIKRLLFFGTMNWYPNVDAAEYIIKHLAKTVSERFPDIVIDIVGANAPQHLLALARDFDNVKIHGFVDDLRPMMRESVFLCPIRDGGGTKLKILDALSTGMPIVADPIACEGISVTHGLNVYFAKKPEEYIHAIEDILKDETMRSRLSIQARNLALSEYSVETIGNKLRHLYAGVASGSVQE